MPLSPIFYTLVVVTCLASPEEVARGATRARALSRTRVRLFLRAADAGMAPLEGDAAAATRWTDAEGGAVDEGDGAVRWLEITVSLPGVHRASDVSAEVLADADARRLSVMATTSGRETPETIVPLPRACDGDAAPRVKFSKKKQTLVVRFPAREDAARPRPHPRAAKDASGGDGIGDGPATLTDATLTDATLTNESEACRVEARFCADENDEENPLAEYLAMLGVAPSGTADDADQYGPGPADDDASTPASTSAEPAPIRDSRFATTKTPKTPALEGMRALSDETSDDTTRNIPSEASPASSASETSAPRSRKKASGRRRKALSAKRFPAPLRSVRLARSVSELDALAERLAAGLHDKGYATAEFITAEAVRVVRSEIANVAPFYTPGEIWLGRDDAGAQISVKSVRGDRVFWMDPEQIEAGRFDALASVLKAIDTLVLDHMARDARRPRNEKRKTARRLAGLADRTHAMLAEYPGRASRFVKHVDNTARDGRRLTVLCYLNEDWRGEHGGALKVYDRTGPDGASERDGAAASLEVAPAGGALAMFYADEVPHEVLPSHRSRHSFTVWYYDRQESEEASRRGRGEDAESPSAVARAAHRPTVDDVSADLDDLAASSFVKTMMTENLSPERAFEAAATLTGPALATAAAVFGAPGADALLATLKRITREELRELRSEMVNMGMQA